MSFALEFQAQTTKEEEDTPGNYIQSTLTSTVFSVKVEVVDPNASNDVDCTENLNN